MNRPKENPEFQKKFMHALQEFSSEQSGVTH